MFKRINLLLVNPNLILTFLIIFRNNQFIPIVLIFIPSINLCHFD